MDANLGTFSLKGRIPDVILACMKYLRTRFPSVRISVEVEKPRRPGLQELAAEADVVFYSRSWAEVGNLLVFSRPFDCQEFPLMDHLCNREMAMDQLKNAFGNSQP